jgi:hypothetical protein
MNKSLLDLRKTFTQALKSGPENSELLQCFNQIGEIQKITLEEIRDKANMDEIKSYLDSYAKFEILRVMRKRTLNPNETLDALHQETESEENSGDLSGPNPESTNFESRQPNEGNHRSSDHEILPMDNGKKSLGGDT